MYLYTKHFGLLGLFALLMFSACQKDPVPIVTTPSTDLEWTPRLEQVTASLQGHVVDKDNNPIKDATVTINGNTTTTNQYGLFFFRNMQMNSKGAYVTVKKDGFFEGSRRFFPQENSKNNIKIELLPQVFSTEFNASAGGSHTFENSDVQLIFPPNAIRNETTGEAYEGIVFVAAQYLDPNDLSFLNQMPGSLQGLNTSTEEVALKTLGMLAVELQGSGGEKLNLAEGHTATISVPAPTNIGDLPTEVPLWSFNETHGIWVEESLANLENGIYTGEVSHFSFWNWDIDVLPVDFIGTFTDAEGNPIPNMSVRLISSSLNVGYGQTNNMGVISGIVPEGEVFTIELIDHCEAIVYTTEIGPYASGSDVIENITVDVPAINSTSISGIITDCDGSSLANSLLVISYNDETNQYFTPNQDGTFEFYLSPCVSATTATIRAINLDNFRQTTLIAINLNSDNDLGFLTTCDDIIGGGFLNLILGEDTLSYGVYTQVYEDQVSIFRHDSITAATIFIEFGFYGTSVGSYDNELNYISSLYHTENNLSHSNWSTESSFESFEVSTFTDNEIIGTFSGNLLYNPTGEFEFVEGSFSVNPE